MKKMKVLLLMVSLIVSTFITKAQKSGILQKDHYGAFTGNDWEDFLAGKRASDFEKKSNVTLKNYLQNVHQFVTQELKEPTIASAVMNSTVVAFPEGSDVYTADADGNWKTRKAYPGEKGYLHTQTKMCWLSFSCGNLVASQLFGAPSPSTPSTPYQKPTHTAVTTTEKTDGSSSSATSVLTMLAGTSKNDHSDLALGFYMRQAALDHDAIVLKSFQSSPCNNCPQGTTTPVQQVVYAQPSMVAQAQPAVYYPPQGQAQNGYTDGHLDVDVINRARAVDWVNAGANVAGAVFSGINTIRGVRFEQQRVVAGNYMVGYNNGYWSTPPVVNPGFQGSNQPGNVIAPGFTNVATTNTGTYSNGNWGTNTGTPGGGLRPIGYY